MELFAQTLIAVRTKVPVVRHIHIIIKLNVVFWRELVPTAWQSLSFDQKIIWIYAANNIIALLSIAEVFLLKRIR